MGFQPSPYLSLDEFKAAISEPLSLDIRSPFQKKKHAIDAEAARGKGPQVVFEGNFRFHGLELRYELVAEERDSPAEEQGKSHVTVFTRIVKVEIHNAIADTDENASAATD